MASHKKDDEQLAPTGQLKPWRMPQPFCCTTEVLDKMYPLFVYNSLTRSKVRFIPQEAGRISWYHCDILRRIVSGYFGYSVLQCQNITDIDDKIILRAAERGISFDALAKQYEKEFLEDMAMLGVKLPDICTRVSEFVPEIVAYIQVLLDKRIAYTVNGSVYFSVSAFEAQGGVYGKLVPEQIGNSALLAEGEGALAASADCKQHPADFALWKAPKSPEEPSWPAPWGAGRPGWHIECSVMAQALRAMGGAGQDAKKPQTIDIHAGGVDLKFPHHENEIAQSEGYSGSHQWVNYWLHTGHLHINGAKMSKSLKNFTSIRGALESYSPRIVRMLFLTHKYNAPMEYSVEAMSQAAAIDKSFHEFFQNLKVLLRTQGNSIASSAQAPHAAEEVLATAFQEVQRAVRRALCDDFDTPRAVSLLQELVKATYKYMDAVGQEAAVTTLLLSVGRYITDMLKTFGLTPSGVEVGMPASTSNSASSEGEQEHSSESSSSSSKQQEQLLDILTSFRQMVRTAAMGGDCSAILRLADTLRDDTLPEVGVRLEDQGAASSVWKLEDPEVLRRERLAKEEAAAIKAKAKAEAAARLAEKEARARLPAEDMYRGGGGAGGAGLLLYSQWDEFGVPTHTAEGVPLAPSAVKKLQKEWKKQKDLHTKYLQQQGQGQGQGAGLDQGVPEEEEMMSLQG